MQFPGSGSMRRSHGSIWLHDIPGGTSQLLWISQSPDVHGSIVTLAHHPYWRSFHTFACLTCKLLEDSGPFVKIPLTARSSRSFCRCANLDIGIVFTSTDEQDDLFKGHTKLTEMYLGLIPYMATSTSRVERRAASIGSGSAK